MTVTDDHVKALRAMLAGEMEEYEEVADRIMATESPRYFNVILASAFTIAVHRRFAEGYTLIDIIQFVADQRTQFDDAADIFDPLVAEQLLLSVLTGEPMGEVDETAKAEAELGLLVGLIDDLELDEAGIAEFVEEARKGAERIMPQFEESLRGLTEMPDRWVRSGDN